MSMRLTRLVNDAELICCREKKAAAAEGSVEESASEGGVLNKWGGKIARGLSFFAMDGMGSVEISMYASICAQPT